jgi:hypothetical protein
VFASAIIRFEGSAPTVQRPALASLRSSWPIPAAESSSRAPGPARNASSVVSSMRWKRNSESTELPVGITSDIS